MERCNIVKCYVLLLMCSQLWIVHMECHQVEPGKKHSKFADNDDGNDDAVVAAVNKRAATHRNHKKNNNNENSNNDNKNHNNKNHHHKKNHDIYNDENINNGDNAGNGHKRGGRRMHRRQHGGEEQDIALWIEEQQLQMLSALFFPQSFSQGRLYIIEGGHVLNDIRDAAHIYKFLTIPSEVKYVNFTWKSGTRKYYYNFDNLQTLDDSILKAPTVSIKTKGRIPCEEKSFSIFLPCAGNASGTAMFTVGLSIENRRGLSLPGTPLRMNFKKECAHRGVYDSLDVSNPSTLKTLQGPDPACNINCGENGYCNHHKICQCKAGYTGQYCQTAFCFPQCLNGGNCTAPSVCTCPEGYQGTQCEGGICKEKCLNGGKCIQKDKCECSKGYYGLRCEFSKCVIPCMNGGRCIDTNRCRCPHGLYGNHCEIGRKLHLSTCKRPCKHGVCTPNKTCKCHNGFYGRFCNARIKKHRQFYR